MTRLFAILTFALLSSPVGAQWSDWYTFATMRTDGGGSTTLQWRVRPETIATNTQAQWRLINNTDRTLYSVAIADKTYTCSNGYTFGRPGEQISHRIESGAAAATYADIVNSDDCPIITTAQFDYSATIVKFSLDQNDYATNWGEYGRVSRE